jgi:hypothetical protein
MSTALTDQVLAALAAFSGTSRLYALTIGDAGTDGSSLLVEAFAADDALDGIGTRDVIALPASAYLDLKELLGRRPPCGSACRRHTHPLLWAT